MKRRAMLAGASLFAVASAARAQEAYPTKPIRFVVPTAAGGASDITARLIAAKLEKSLGQPIVVDPRPGANGNIGAELVLKEPADGYTIMMGHIGVMTVNVHLYKDVNFNPLKDFVPVAQVVSYSNLLVVHPSVPAKNVSELIAYARTRKLNYGSPGYGGSLHIGMELFKLMAQIDMEHVAYKGAAPALADLVAGHIQLSFSDPLATLQMVRSGGVRALAVSGARRSSVAPDIPTVAESGLPGYDVQGWVGVVARTGTPADRIAKLNEHINRAVAMPDVTKALLDGGADINTGPPAQFGAFMQREYDRWGDVVKKAKLKVD
jgi:tripartite-type tricarboxylate transporter receptor subunit TctC